MGDIDSILTQAGATVEGRKMLSNPNIYQKIAEYRSYVSKAPDQVAVPPNVVNVYRNILTDLGPIQEKFVKDRVAQQGEFYRQKGESLAGKKKYDDMLKRVMDGYTVQIPGATPADNSDISNMSDDDLRKLAGGK